MIVIWGSAQGLTRRLTRFALYSLSCIGLSACIFAADKQSAPPVVDLVSYRAYLDDIQSKVNADPRRGFEKDERSRLNEVSEELATRLDGVETVGQLREDELLRVLELNEELHGIILVESSLNRRVCRIETQTGTQIPKSTCWTRYELAQQREQARNLLDERRVDIERILWLQNLERPRDGTDGFPQTPMYITP